SPLVGRDGLDDLHGAIPHGARDRHGVRGRELLRLPHLFLHRVEVPQTLGLLLDLLVALTARARAEHIAHTEPDHESHFPPHGFSSHPFGCFRVLPARSSVAPVCPFRHPCFCGGISRTAPLCAAVRPRRARPARPGPGPSPTATRPPHRRRAPSGSPCVRDPCARRARRPTPAAP